MEELVEILSLLKQPGIILAALIILAPYGAIYMFYKLMIKKEDVLDRMQTTLSETVILLNKLFDSRRNGRG